MVADWIASIVLVGGAVYGAFLVCQFIVAGVILGVRFLRELIDDWSNRP